MNFETWGFTERYEWTQAPRGLPIDKDLKRKVAYNQLWWALSGFDKDSSVAKNKMKAQQLVFDRYPNNNTVSFDS